jgi:hypothetical protein
MSSDAGEKRKKRKEKLKKKKTYGRLADESIEEFVRVTFEIGETLHDGMRHIDREIRECRLLSNGGGEEMEHARLVGANRIKDSVSIGLRERVGLLWVLDRYLKSSYERERETDLSIVDTLDEGLLQRIRGRVHGLTGMQNQSALQFAKDIMSTPVYH